MRYLSHIQNGFYTLIMAILADFRIRKPKWTISQRNLTGLWPPGCSDLTRDLLVPSSLHLLRIHSIDHR